MNERTAMGIGHWAFTQNPDGPAWGFGKGKGKVRASRSAAAGLVLCRIRRADQEVLCISSPYWRLLLPVKGATPPLPSYRPAVLLEVWYTTVCPQQEGRIPFLRCICTILVSTVLRGVMGWCRYVVRSNSTQRGTQCRTRYGTLEVRAPSWAEQSERTPRLGPSKEAKSPVLAAQVDTGRGGAGQWGHGAHWN